LLTLLDLPERSVFLVGVLPALLVFWIRRAVPEPVEWKVAKARADDHVPRFIDLFRGPIGWVTFPALLVCAATLTAHWAFMFWFPQQLRNLADVADWSDSEKNQLVIVGITLVMFASIGGNFLASAIASRIGYRVAVATMCLMYFATMAWTYSVPREHQSMYFWLLAIGVCQGVFALFTMYLPPLFPPLLRTTGAGFCFNFGRIAAAFGTVYSGGFGQGGDYRVALFYASFLFLLGAAFALLLPELPSPQKIAAAN
jgi:MFS family permease